MSQLTNRTFRDFSLHVGRYIEIGLGLLFMAAAVPKITHPYVFVSQIYDYMLVAPKLGIIVAVGLPWIQMLVAACLIIGLWRPGALLMAVAMMVIFVIAQLHASYEGIGIGCGCFGDSSASAATSVGTYTIARDSVVLLASASAFIIQLRKQSKVA